MLAKEERLRLLTLPILRITLPICFSFLFSFFPANTHIKMQ